MILTCEKRIHMIYTLINKFLLISTMDALSKTIECSPHARIHTLSIIY